MKELILQLCAACSVAYDDIVSDCRTDDVSTTRQIIWFELRKHNMPYHEIGSLFGRGKNAVWSGIKRIDGLLEIGDPYVLKQQQRIEDVIQSSSLVVSSI